MTRAMHGVEGKVWSAMGSWGKEQLVREVQMEHPLSQPYSQ